jgi:hypothetical protein
MGSNPRRKQWEELVGPRSMKGTITVRHTFGRAGRIRVLPLRGVRVWSGARLLATGLFYRRKQERR